MTVVPLASAWLKYNREDDPRLQPLFDSIVNALQALEQRGVRVLLRHRPRKLNKVADRLAHKAKVQQESTFDHALFQCLQPTESRATETSINKKQWVR